MKLIQLTSMDGNTSKPLPTQDANTAARYSAAKPVAVKHPSRRSSASFA